MRGFKGTRYANVTSTMALVVALGGTGAYAANTIRSSDIVNGQVKRADIANNAVTSGKVSNGTLRIGDFRAADRALLRGPAGANGANGANGAPGAPGAKGDPGTPATRLFTAVNSGAAPTLVKAQGATAVDRSLGVGEYRVTWDRDITNCVWLGTAGGVETGGVPPSALVTIHRSSTGPTVLFVNVRSDAGALVDADFSVAVFC